MIDFKEKRFGYKSIGKEDEEMLELRSADILKDLENEKTNFYYLGVHLIDLYNSGGRVSRICKRDNVRTNANRI